VRAPLVIWKASIIYLTALSLHIGYTSITSTATYTTEEGRQNVRTSRCIDVLTLLIRIGADLWSIGTPKE
jgi:hypothetical protein